MRRFIFSILILTLVASLNFSCNAQDSGGGTSPRGMSWMGDRSSGDVALEKAPLAANDFEKNALEVLESILENERFRNVPEHDGRLLRILVQSMQAKNVIEIGTSTGYSAIWMALGLKSTGGHLTTYEIDAERAATARKNFEASGMADLVTLIEGDAHELVTELEEPIDLLFLDADKEGYVDYLEKLLPLVRSGGLIVAHNINPRMADPDYMEAITTDVDLETVVRGGMGITLKK
ncbi:MAG: O-methyltransferase [Verrucomicrobiota bacterium]